MPVIASAAEGEFIIMEEGEATCTAAAGKVDDQNNSCTRCSVALRRSFLSRFSSTTLGGENFAEAEGPLQPSPPPPLPPAPPPMLLKPGSWPIPPLAAELELCQKRSKASQSIHILADK